MFANKKFIFLNNYKYSAGLNDMKDRFIEYLKLSKILNLIPILPEIFLSNKHTKKKNNLLIDYIEIPEFVCKEFPLDKEEIFYWNLTSPFIPNDKLFNIYRDQIMNLNMDIDFLEKYKKIAIDVVQSLKKPICVVHVRRGDYLKIHSSLNDTTSPKNIKKVLDKYNFNDCYIKTNESNSSFFDELTKHYNVKFFKDFSILQEIYDSGDNYALYSVECCIRNLCDIKISTFDTTKSEQCWLPNNDIKFFDDYLDEHKGYQ